MPGSRSYEMNLGEAPETLQFVCAATTATNPPLTCSIRSSNALPTLETLQL